MGFQPQCYQKNTLLIAEREQANLVVSTADFSIYNKIYTIILISGTGRHHTVMFYMILNTPTNVKIHRSRTKLHVFEARLYAKDAALAKLFASFFMQRNTSRGNL